MIIRFGAQASDKQAVWISFKSTPSSPFIFSFIGVYASGSGLHTSYTGEKKITYTIVGSDLDIPADKKEPVTFGVAQYGEYKFTYNSDVDDVAGYEFDGWYWDAQLTSPVDTNQTYVITSNRTVYGTYYKNPELQSYNGEYDGNSHSVTVNNAGTGGTLQYSTDGTNWVDGSPTIITRKDVGTSTVYARVLREGNKPTTKDPASATINITKKAITIEVNNKSCNVGSPIPAFDYGTPQGVVGSEVPAFTGSLTTDAANTNTEGAYSITQGTLALADNSSTGFVANNYTLIVTPGLFLVTNKPVPTIIPAKTLDTTGAITDINISTHNCNDYSVSKYDGTYHWNECSICSPKYVSAGRPNDNSWTNTYLEIKTNAAGQRILVIKNSRKSHTWSNEYWSLGNDNCSSKMFI